MISWEIKDSGNYLSKRVGEYEVTIERKTTFYHVAIWKGEYKDLVEEQDIQGNSAESELRAITLGNQLVRQLRGESK